MAKPETLTLDEWEAVAACVERAPQTSIDEHCIAVGCKPVDLDSLYEKLMRMHNAEERVYPKETP